MFNVWVPVSGNEWVGKGPDQGKHILLNMGSEEAVSKSRRKVAEGNKAVKTGCGIIS